MWKVNKCVRIESTWLKTCNLTLPHLHLHFTEIFVALLTSQPKEISMYLVEDLIFIKITLVHAKEWWNDELEGIVPYNLGDGVWPTLERANLRWGPTRRSFWKCSQTLSPTSNLCGTWCWSCCFLYLALALSNMSWTCERMCWMRSMKLLSLSASEWTWTEFSWVAANGITTSMGHNCWNPNPTWKGLWLVEIWRDLL